MILYYRKHIQVGRLKHRGLGIEKDIFYYITEQFLEQLLPSFLFCFSPCVCSHPDMIDVMPEWILRDDIVLGDTY